MEQSVAAHDLVLVCVCGCKKHIRQLTSLCSSIWFYTLSGGFRVSIQATMAPYATSAWSQHTLLTVIETVASALTGACYIPLAKLLDLWGRAEGFMLMVCMLSLGLVLQAAASNLPTYCAGRVRCNRLNGSSYHSFS